MQRVTDDARADLCVINTCTVTAEADRQARQQVRRAIKSNPGAWIVVTGCYAQMDPGACAEIPGVDLVVGNNRKLDIPNLVDELFKHRLPQVIVGDMDRDISLPSDLVSGFDGRSRAFVQIQQGCDQGCTFCIIHTARGPNRSFAADAIQKQVSHLIENGYREIVLCGVDIGSYGCDADRSRSGTLPELVDGLASLPGDFRLRLSSIDPAHISDELIAVLKNHRDTVCPQLHLSLQSGNTLILKRMKRRATRPLIDERIAELRRAVPDLVLSADVLVGFPTEDESHFEDTLSAIYELEIAFPHVFAYSARNGTPAARIPRQVEKPVRKERAARARKAGAEVWYRVAERLVGSQQKMLLERGGNSDQWVARGSNYFPASLIAPAGYKPLQNLNAGDWIQAEITGFDKHRLIARIVP